MNVLMRERDLSDAYLRFAQQVGADGVDIHSGENLPGGLQIDHLPHCDSDDGHQKIASAYAVG